MRAFAALYERLDRSTGTLDKVAALAAYFGSSDPADAAWGLHFLAGAKLKRLLTGQTLRELVIEASGLPAWLVEDTYAHVGDLAETATLLVQPAVDPQPADAGYADIPLHCWAGELLPQLRRLDPARQRAQVLQWWSGMPDEQRYMLNKLLTGALRVGVSRGVAVQALAALSGLEADLLAHRLSGDWQPTPATWAALLAPAGDTIADDRPYPFFLASALEQPLEDLGEPQAWQAEWKWDGIRAQLLRRRGQVTLWSRGEERLDGRFPELEALAATLPDCVLDGEILAWREAAPLPFAALQKRIGRLKPGPKLLAECPAAFLAYDLLECDGADQRALPLAERRSRLEALAQASGGRLQVSPLLPFGDWDALAGLRAQARGRGVEGVMLKRRDSAYQVGRRRGDWWKWKIAPLTVDAVLIYAQAGHGRRANLHTDYTFAVWTQGSEAGERLVPFAKAYSGLTDAEIARLDQWIRGHTLERFGPVRVVRPLLVFELAFENIALSNRHKSGVAVRFPRILRWREDKRAEDADRLESLRALIAAQGEG